MADNYILCISDDYPESYWLKAKVLSGEDSSIFKEGLVVTDSVVVRFESAKGISARKLLEYDFFFSDGPNLISPRLYELMVKEGVSGVQFIDAELVVSGVSYAGYKLFNVVTTSPVFDLKGSESEPLLSYLPDGPRWFTKIVLAEGADLSSDIIRAEEDIATIVVAARVKTIFEKNNICGVQFKV
ncbi:hypothetical protein [Pseudomonas sp. WHRI 8519]|uniref:hypothetical protein n=1 Tax=Pseudomonas sp. WHRI 8519 TaxID=3162567 RepID=UPI0032F00D6A